MGNWPPNPFFWPPMPAVYLAFFPGQPPAYHQRAAGDVAPSWAYLPPEGSVDEQSQEADREADRDEELEFLDETCRGLGAS